LFSPIVFKSFIQTKTSKFLGLEVVIVYEKK